MLSKLLIILLIILIYIGGNIKISDSFTIDEYVDVEIRGEIRNPGIFHVARNSSFNDLLTQIELTDDADISSISLFERLNYHDVIVIPKKTEDKKISINSADLNELMALPGIGEKTAMKIIEYRISNGGFKNIEDIKNVSGIKEKTFDKFKDFITL